MNFKRVFIFSTLAFLCACSSALSQVAVINDFESCVAAGNKVLRSYPAKCVAPGVGTFTQVLANNDQRNPPTVSEPLRYESACKDTCGDGQCAEMVCQAVGCPCPESRESCPRDCR